jgi:hypothetical protein
MFNLSDDEMKSETPARGMWRGFDRLDHDDAAPAIEVAARQAAGGRGCVQRTARRPVH